MLKRKNKITQIRRIVWKHYQTQGRNDLPWRHTTDPYRIMVSELMLQQTQVSRVIAPYTAFIKKFPSVRALARAPLAQVITAWKGLGYNRRARYLHECAQILVEKYKGVVPSDKHLLETLPGIGSYTAAAIMAFAYDRPTVCIETNIRTVFLHHFFPKTKRSVSDKELLLLIESALDAKRPRQWYWALMDYGAYLKQQGVRAHQKSAGYTKQSPFEGSRRQVRGAIIRALVEGPKSFKALATLTPYIPTEQLVSICTDLEKERLIQKRRILYFLSEKP